jgi:ferredoxin
MRFEIDDEGVARMLQNGPDESLRAQAETAAQRCPESVITIVD